MTPQSDAPKIFCIGLSKTGTTSLAAALELLGYKVRDNIGVTRYIPGDLSCIDPSELESHNAFTDTPIPSFYRQLDTKYPNAKFILTIREKNAWLKSCKKQFTQRHAEARHDAVNDLFRDIYDAAWFDEVKFSVGYDRFVEGVKEYFKDRPNDLLILDLTKGDGWKELCGFLNQPIPDIPFPVTNVTKIQWIKAEDVAGIAKKAGSSIPSPDSLVLPNANGLINRIINKIRTTIVMRRRAKLAKMLDAAYQTIVDSLKEIDASIPVLSQKTKNIPYSERKQWSHVWLVDTFTGERLLLEGANGYSINIALVENGDARLGVVYFPATDTVYYTKNGTTSYKQSGTGEALHLKSDSAKSNAAATTTETNKQSAPLALCLAAEDGTQQPLIQGKFNEWEIAAAHAILNGTGKGIESKKNHEKPKYNKEIPTVTI